MKLQLLPSTIETSGGPSARQHLTCFIIDDCVAVDAGSLAISASETHRERVRDVVLTHAHLDHIAGLPLFIDDLFSSLSEPVTIHCTRSVAEIMERDIFNWSVYPRFSELSNSVGPVLRYRTFEPGDEFKIQHLKCRSVEVNHKVPSVGLLISDDHSTIALSGDTAEMDGFWTVINSAPQISSILLECAFPDELEDLAHVSHHLTPKRLARELVKCTRTNCQFYIVNLKPMYRDQILSQISALGHENVVPLEVGKSYKW